MDTLVLKDFMTASPHSIEPHENLLKARDRMREHGCRHLPVLVQGRVVGVLSERDILSAYPTTHSDLTKMTVGETMMEEVFKLEQGDLVRDACRLMLKNKLGSILVMDKSKLVGIFTDSDAMRALLKVIG
jgi:acetoin utilization protein AcuB